WAPSSRGAPPASEESVSQESQARDAQGWSSDRLLADQNDPAAAAGVYKAEWDLDISERRQTLSLEPGALRQVLRDKKLAWLNPQPDEAAEAANAARPEKCVTRAAAVYQGARSVLAAKPAAKPKRWTDLELFGVALSG